MSRRWGVVSDPSSSVREKATSGGRVLHAQVERRERILHVQRPCEAATPYATSGTTLMANTLSNSPDTAPTRRRRFQAPAGPGNNAGTMQPDTLTASDALEPLDPSESQPSRR